LYNAFMRFTRQSNGQIRALKTFTLYDGRTIAAGTLGGVIASRRSLSQSGTAWVFQGGKIEGNGYVSGNALVASGGEVLGNAKVYGNATVGNNGTITGEARVLGNASVIGNATRKSTVNGEAFPMTEALPNTRASPETVPLLPTVALP
jgi:hypothetical protein